jgi:hypothetical protein
VAGCGQKRPQAPDSGNGGPIPAGKGIPVSASHIVDLRKLPSSHPLEEGSFVVLAIINHITILLLIVLL